MLHPKTDLGSHVVVLDANASADSAAPSLITAAGTGDATKVTGVGIDRKQGQTLALSAAVTTSFLAALADTKTLSLAHEIQYSSDNSTFDTAVVLEASAVKATGETGGTNERGQAEFSINLISQKRYFRINVTPDLSATGTDTASFATQAALGGFSELPR